MNVDASIVQSYLQGKDDYSEHWVFYHVLEQGGYAFSKPDSAQKEMVEEISSKMLDGLNHFEPYNLELYTKLFPRWRELACDVNVILAVGCPAPYDAMVRAYNGKEYMIFDLIRFLEYQKEGADILLLTRQLITHELAHVCIHADYPVISNPYTEALGYITFDEGFAHILAFSDRIETYDFASIIQAHYPNARNKLKAALLETDVQKQKEFLEASNCGPYWDKFAAMSGKLYIAAHRDQIYEIYQNGPAALMGGIIKE
jgi:hypothetical protein